MTDFFKTLEQEYCLHINKANKQLVHFMNLFNRQVEISNSTQEDKESLFQETKNEVRSVEEFVNQMEVHANIQPEKKRRDFTQKIRIYKGDYNDTRKKFLKLESEYLERKEKKKLMGDLEKGPYNNYQENGYKTDASDSIIDKQNKKLKEALTQGYETLSVADETQKNLEGQTETLSKGKERLINMNTHLTESFSLIKQMQDKVFENRMRMYTVLGFIGASVLIVFCSYVL